jgi:hypothetical protein
MTDKITLNFTFSINGDNLKVNKSGNFKEMLSKVPPMHGVYLATLVLAIGLVIEKDEQLLDVIKLLGTPDDVERVTGALQAIQMLILAGEMKKEMEKAEKADQN